MQDFTESYMGISVNGGKVLGEAFCYQKDLFGVPCYEISQESVDAEWKRYQSALELAKVQLLEYKKNIKEKLGENEAEVFEIQLALLEDDYLSKALHKELQTTLRNVEFCLKNVIEACLQQFKGHAMLHVRESCLDFNDVTSRILKNLLSISPVAPLKVNLQGKIIVANNLEPSDVVDLADKGIAAIVLADACLNSHAIIVARGLNIPIVAGVEAIHLKVTSNDVLLVDGSEGKVFVNPSKAFADHYLAKTESKKKLTITQKSILDVDFWLSYDAHLTKEFMDSSQVRGIGLLRSESIFLAKDELPKEEEQFLFYKSVVEKFAPYPVVLRVLDVGGDKIAKGSVQREPNPFLGVRGIRYCLHNSGLFKHQLRAMLRASAFGKVQILYPMITGVEDLLQANALLEECKLELRNEKIAYDDSIPIGSMIEIPSAVLLMDHLSNFCQFFSLGTNDLVQYTLAADRTNNLVAKRYGDLHPSILRMLKMVFKNAQTIHTPITVCGEMASSIKGFLVGLALGFRSFCVYGKQIECLKSILCNLSKEDLAFIADKMWSFNNSQEISRFFEKFLNKI